MHRIWQFAHPGIWTPLPTYPFAWPDDWSDAEALQAAGYTSDTALGIPDVIGGGTIWTCQGDGSPYAFLVTVALPGDQAALVVMADVPDVLAYLAQYGSISFAAMLNQWSEGIERTLQKNW